MTNRSALKFEACQVDSVAHATPCMANPAGNNISACQPVQGKLLRLRRVQYHPVLHDLHVMRSLEVGLHEQLGA